MQSAPQKLRLCALFCGLIVLAGCNPGWEKAGASRQEFYQDRSVCSEEAQRPGGALYRNPFTGEITQERYTNSRLFNACMKEHGWSPAGQPAYD